MKELKANGSTIARIFSATVFKELANRRQSPLLESLVRELRFNTNSFKSLGELFDYSYGQLSECYRNEYLYKNSIANNIFLNQHPLDSSAMLSEFRISSSKADAMILNGTSHIYEIKTELDSLDRLDKQLNDYLAFSEFVSVVADKSHIEKLATKLASSIGIIEFTNKDELNTVRKPESNISNINPEVIFDSLRQSEYVSVVSDFYGFVPDVPNTLMYAECKKLFVNIPIETLHQSILAHLKRRTNSIIKNEFISGSPVSLKAATICSSLNKKQIQNLSAALSDSFI